MEHPQNQWRFRSLVKTTLFHGYGHITQRVPDVLGMIFLGISVLSNRGYKSTEPDGHTGFQDSGHSGPLSGPLTPSFP